MKPDFFMELTQRRNKRCFFISDAAARKGPLACMGAQICRPQRQQDRSATGHIRHRTLLFGLIAGRDSDTSINWINIFVSDRTASHDDYSDSRPSKSNTGMGAHRVTEEVGPELIIKQRIEVNHLS